MYSIIERQPVRAAYNILNSWTAVVEIHVFYITTVNGYQSVSSTEVSGCYEVIQGQKYKRSQKPRFP
jgi:hypothetical protein